MRTTQTSPAPERLFDKEGLAHTSPSIDGNKLGTVAVIVTFQFVHFLFSSDNMARNRLYFATNR